MPDNVFGSSKGNEDSAAGKLERDGISRTSADQFEIGGYRYSSLNDAVAEAGRRERKGGSA